MADNLVKSLVDTTQQLIKDNWEEARNQETGVNLFGILGIEGKENYHSKFLAYLLDPSASHNCGADFLNLFLKQLTIISPDFPTAEEFGTSRARVGIEHFCGEKGEIDGVAIGGRIDIVIFPGNENQGKVMPIVIENKIYAGDQPDQLVRAKNEFKNGSWLYYLTRFGNLASSYTAGNLVHNNAFNGYQSISNKHFIHSWLENCANVQKSKQAITHSIKSYTLTIERLTDKQSKLQIAMINNLLESLSGTDDVLGTLTQLKNSVNRFLPDLNRKFADNLQSDLGSDFKVEPNESFGSRYAFIRIRPINWKSNYIAIGFDAWNKTNKQSDIQALYCDGNISLCSDSPVNKEDSKNLKQKLKSKDLAFFKNFEDENTEAPFFYFYKYFSEFGMQSDDWGKTEILTMNEVKLAVPYADAIRLVFDKVMDLEDTTWL